MKAEDIYDNLVKTFSSGNLKKGQKLPTERSLAEEYGVSRPTISKVLNRLQDEGILRRVVGAGTFLSIEDSNITRNKEQKTRTLGLFIPGLGKGEIFEPICARIAELSQEYNFTLIWGSIPSRGEEHWEEKLLQSAHRFIEQGVDGIFYQPVEREIDSENLNLQIVKLFDDTSIPLVLLDCDYLHYPERSNHDLIGLDNISAAYQLTEHFIKQEQKRVDFLWPPNTAGTYSLRLIGYREALLHSGINPTRNCIHEGDPRDSDYVKTMVEAGAQNIICVNDETAAQLIQTLFRLGYQIPSDIRVAGFDDVKYARLAPIPLTTFKQPCREIGEFALRILISRIETPMNLPITVQVPGKICIRESTKCGS